MSVMGLLTLWKLSDDLGGQEDGYRTTWAPTPGCPRVTNISTRGLDGGGDLKVVFEVSARKTAGKYQRRALDRHDFQRFDALPNGRMGSSIPT